VARRAAAPAADAPGDVRRARRHLLVDAIGIVLSVFAFGVVYGLAARSAGLSLAETVAMSVFVFAGASQFVAAGLIAQGAAWPAIVLLTALLNARHLLYSAALVPWLRDRPAPERAAIAYGVTDEAFALSVHHFGRLGRADVPGFWIAAVCVWLPWNVATVVGAIGGQVVPDPTRLGLDVVFPAAMAGLAILLVRSRRDLLAALVGGALAVALGLATDPSIGVVVGGLVGPLVALVAIPGEGSAVGEMSEAYGFTLRMDPTDTTEPPGPPETSERPGPAGPPEPAGQAPGSRGPSGPEEVG
jgi:4-azaleucine resistance transporter AzlC